MRYTSPWAARKAFDPEGWAVEVRAVILRHAGDLAAAAKEMDIKRRSLQRWLACSKRANKPSGPRKGRSTQEARCGVCDGCKLAQGLPLSSGGRPKKDPP